MQTTETQSAPSSAKKRMAKKRIDSPPDLAETLRQSRIARNESQSRFWGRFGITQSRGSRFELGARIPSPVAILLKLYMDGSLSDGDLYRARRRKTFVAES